MHKYTQTISRIALGLTVVGATIWLLWPSQIDNFLDPEPLFVFFTALAVWIAAEIKTSEEVIFRHSTPNDIRVARELLRLHSEDFRIILKDHDLFQLIDYSYFGKIDELLHRRSSGKLLFQKRELDTSFEKVVENLSVFRRFMAENTTPEMFGNRELLGFKPIEIVAEDEYRERMDLARKANEIATSVWKDLDGLSGRIRREVPEALDEVL